MLESEDKRRREVAERLLDLLSIVVAKWLNGVEAMSKSVPVCPRKKEGEKTHNTVYEDLGGHQRSRMAKYANVG